MELNSLLKWRSYVPGFLLVAGAVPGLLVLYPAIGKMVEESLKLAGSLVFLVLIFPIGFLYNHLRIREVLFRESKKPIEENMRKRLLEISGRQNLSEPTTKAIYQSKHLNSLFWKLVDNDKTLKEKANRVRDNGLTWSSTLDVAMIGFFWMLVYSALWIIVPTDAQFGMFATVSGGFMLIGFFVHRLLRPKHLALCNEQLDHIESELSAEVKARIDDIAVTYESKQ